MKAKAGTFDRQGDSLLFAKAGTFYRQGRVYGEKLGRLTRRGRYYYCFGSLGLSTASKNLMQNVRLLADNEVALAIKWDSSQKRKDMVKKSRTRGR